MLLSQQTPVRPIEERMRERSQETQQETAMNLESTEQEQVGLFW